MAESSPTEYFIQGITKSGKKFRPSDWSERLCGVMSAFGPKPKGPNAYMQYSIYVRPTIIGDTKAVIVDSRLRDIDPMAFDFVLNFASDNDLVVSAACELPLHHGARAHARLLPTRLVRAVPEGLPGAQLTPDSGAHSNVSDQHQCTQSASKVHACIAPAHDVAE
jgi:hypothetical protein